MFELFWEIENRW